MPYIPPQDRFDLNPREGSWEEPRTSGELSFVIAMLLARYFVRNGQRWQQISDIYGALKGATDEFKKHVADPYEDKQRHQNGGIFDNCLPG